MGDVSGRFHIFLSHVWGSGQDQMRVVKQRLIEMLPDAAVFLDVDDLAEGKGAEYVDVSQISLIFVSAGYFISENCMRELLRAVVTGKPIVTLRIVTIGLGVPSKGSSYVSDVSGSVGSVSSAQVPSA